MVTAHIFPHTGFYYMFFMGFHYMVRASGKLSGLLGRVALETLSKNPDDLNNGIQLMVPLWKVRRAVVPFYDPL